MGATKGKTPKTIAEMTKEAKAFIHALAYEKVDLVGLFVGRRRGRSFILYSGKPTNEPIVSHGLLLQAVRRYCKVYTESISKER